MAFLHPSLETVACKLPGLSADPFEAPSREVDPVARLTLSSLPISRTSAAPKTRQQQQFWRRRHAAGVAAASPAHGSVSLLRGVPLLFRARLPLPLSWQSRLSNPLLNSSFSPHNRPARSLRGANATSRVYGRRDLAHRNRFFSQLLPPLPFDERIYPSAKRAAPDASASDSKTQRPRKRGRPSYKDRAAAAAAAAAEVDAKKAAARAALRESAFGSSAIDSEHVTSLGENAASAPASLPHRRMPRILPRAVPMRAPLVPGLTQVPNSAALMAGLLPHASSADLSAALHAALEQARCRAAFAEAAAAVGPSLEQRAQLWMARLTAALQRRAAARVSRSCPFRS
ncbi:hypothetical protein CLOM_g3382 [Closterium sp. NIES-68]|nr:hypothetical protein CLOM_g3382 [Closterium sp. NIES-68]